jgi:hypothetical protein
MKFHVPFSKKYCHVSQWPVQQWCHVKGIYTYIFLMVHLSSLFLFLKGWCLIPIFNWKFLLAFHISTTCLKNLQGLHKTKDDKIGSMYDGYSTSAKAVFKQFCLYWLSCTTGTSIIHNSVSLVATATTQWAYCNCYQFLAHMKNVLQPFILVLHACANSSIVFNWTQISFRN